MTTVNQIQCSLCKHYREALVGPGTCGAFPDGIPFEVYTGQIPHFDPLEGDNGIQFEISDKELSVSGLSDED
jgi:hypothetical protein